MNIMETYGTEIGAAEVPATHRISLKTIRRPNYRRP